MARSESQVATVIVTIRVENNRSLEPRRVLSQNCYASARSHIRTNPVMPSRHRHRHRCQHTEMGQSAFRKYSRRDQTDTTIEQQIVAAEVNALNKIQRHNLLC